MPRAETHRSAQARYALTEKGRATRRRYNRSDKHRTADLRYRATEAGVILRDLYDQRPDVLLRKRLYGQTRRFD